ncbi:YdeI family protein [Aquabacterium sp. J223]|uniref:YdeI/OmpD-associated family protein n=1 Tax=Aquabacterium sp. J223 TaxID=2898431 RepID=UPI0021AE0A13|nr:YdeI/OmpD-associated family protein [Aquabacterium sp. J223]UUX96956.1 YdeI/OmpD-associated family protein [Aquabacterium sp. J223]
MMSPPNPWVHPLTRTEWREWLRLNHERATGVWLVSHKKATGRPRVEYDAAVEEALCFGWSRPNKQRVERLLQAGLMAEAGLRKVEQARRDGSWTKLDAIEELQVPDDLAQALAGQPDAARHFDAFPRSAKRGILEWIASAKTAETRARRIYETARLASRNERANQWRPKRSV